MTTPLELDRFREARNLLAKFDIDIKNARAMEKLAMDARVDLWDELDRCGDGTPKSGVRRAVLADWSSIDAMAISRALNLRNAEDAGDDDA